MRNAPGAVRSCALWLAMALGAGVAGGCVTVSDTRTARVGSGTDVFDQAPSRRDVDIISLYALPVALSTDGPDGLAVFQIGVHLFQEREPQSVRLAGGRLEFLLFEGRQRARDIAGLTPVQIWRFSSRQLTSFEQRSMVGFGYQMELPLSGRMPATRTVTILARFIPDRGEPVWSEPLLMQMGPG